MPRRSADVAVQTVIGPELRAALQALGFGDSNKTSRDGSYVWEGELESHMPQGKLSVVVYCQGSPGNQAASTAATQMIERYQPSFMLLSGIAAGRRGKVKIGDVAIPRAVADLTLGVVEAGQISRRPFIERVPHQTRQMLTLFDATQAEFHRRYKELIITPPVDPEVSEPPQIHEAGFASQDLLLRDAEVLENLAITVHQQIRIGEMEAAGFIQACESRAPAIPWLVVRGVSDFGDSNKNDGWHRVAAAAAAAYMASFLQHGLDMSLLRHKRRRTKSSRTKPTSAPSASPTPASRDTKPEASPAAPTHPEPTFKKGQYVGSILRSKEYEQRNGVVLEPDYAPGLVLVKWKDHEPKPVYANTLEVEEVQPEPEEEKTSLQSPLVVVHSRSVMADGLTLYHGITYLYANVTWWSELKNEHSRFSRWKGQGHLRITISGAQLNDENAIVRKHGDTMRSLGATVLRLDEIWRPENEPLRKILIYSIERASLNRDSFCRFGALYDFAVRAGNPGADVVAAFHRKLASIETY